MSRKADPGESCARVLIVDDSAVVRAHLKEILDAEDGLDVVGVAADAFEARDLVAVLSPDVVTLDVEMPKMDGITFLRNLMRLRPLPVVMIAGATQRGARITLEALALGAIDFVGKPTGGDRAELEEYARNVVARVRAAARAQVRPAPAVGPPPPISAISVADDRPSRLLLALGASTGGTEALKEVLRRLPADAPAVLVTQHILPNFGPALAAHLDQSTELRVVVAEQGEPVRSGHVYLAPGDAHLQVTGEPGAFRCRLDEGPPIDGHRPSVDALFSSLARAAAGHSVAAVLTGMGRDGTAGARHLRGASIPVIAQDEASSVIWGMPKSIVERGLATETVALERLAATLLDQARRLVETPEGVA